MTRRFALRYQQFSGSDAFDSHRFLVVHEAARRSPAFLKAKLRADRIEMEMERIRGQFLAARESAKVTSQLSRLANSCPDIMRSWVRIAKSKYLRFHFEIAEGQNTKIPSKYQNPVEI